ncbi:HEPN domain-containing protein [candidate division KSB1 bacterium]|nr:HEPN domain-containing protein [candidate division KSB1 bacterium]
MLSRTDLKKIARARLEDAEVLLQSGRYDSAVYLCGYAVELALKARICLTLNWKEYPFSKAEFQKYQSFRTHELEILLHISGAEAIVKNKYFKEWSDVSTWDPEMRYMPVGSTSQQYAQDMISATKTLLREL